ncbi:hypothetical protein [Nocardia carnea]|uniref:hypothetical protein n=1 Tax=Nocardia carnea TaxID=37328 RepID=UPI002458C444|nr:hypothetical protein [Nocardia carnea]
MAGRIRVAVHHGCGDLAGRVRAISGTTHSGLGEFRRADRLDTPGTDRAGPLRRYGDGGGSRAEGGGAFAVTMRSRQAQPADRTLADLADDVYFPDRSRPISGFVRLDRTEVERAGIPPEAMNDVASGLTSALYRDDAGRYVLAFAGTYRTSLRSWKTNFAQGLGIPARQYVLAGRLGKLARGAFGDDLVITGHSLGGGLATTAALKSGAPAVTFNPAALSDQTIRGLGIDAAAAREYAAAGNIRTYVVAGDPLTVLQDSHWLHRSMIGGLAGGILGSSLGGAMGGAIAGTAGRVTGSTTGKFVGAYVGAAIGGTAGAAGTAGGLAQVRPALGARIDLPDPLPAENNGRVAHSIDIHEMPGVRLALDRTQPWSDRSGS